MAKYAYCLLSLILAQLMYAQTPAYTEWKRGLTASLRTLWLDRGKVEFIDWWVTHNPPYPDSSGGSTYNTWQMAFNSFLNQNLYLGRNLHVVDAWLAANPPCPDTFTSWQDSLSARLRSLWLDPGKVQYIDRWMTNNPPYPDLSGLTYNAWEAALNNFLNQKLYLGTNLQVVDAWLARNPPYPDPMVNVSFAWDADDPIYKVTHYRLYFGTQSGVYTQHVDVKTDTRVTILFFSGFTYYAAVTAFNGVESPYSDEISFDTGQISTSR